MTILQIGTYNPLPNKDDIKELTADSERLRYWISCGAQPSDRVAWLMAQIGLMPEPPMRETTKHALPKALAKGKK